jgi:hypothetical protein
MQFNLSDPRFIIALVVIVLIIAAGIAIFMRQRKDKTMKLRQHFGSEYDRTMLEQGSKQKTEAKLEARESRVEHLKIRDLGATERERFVADWQAVQSRFVDHPKGAVTEADELVASLMQARGYPVADFEQRAADISVNHPGVVQHYRTAHAVATRLSTDEPTTEDLRAAMIQYRTLFDELLQVQAPAEMRSVA